MTYRSKVAAVLDPSAPYQGHPGGDARLALITTMLEGLSKGTTSEETAGARLDMYEMAIGHIPTWAIDRAIRRWLGRDCPAAIEAKPNYSWPPAAATLRGLADIEISYARECLRIVDQLLSIVSEDRANDPTPMPVAGAPRSGVPKLRKM